MSGELSEKMAEFLLSLKPVDPDVFEFAFYLASSAYCYRVPMDSPSNYGFNIDFNDGSTQHIQFMDVGENRAQKALADAFADNTELYMNLSFRIWALQSLAKSKKMKPWTRNNEDPTKIEIHMAVLKVAASHDLNTKGLFDEDSFFHEVKRVADEENSN